MLRRCVLALYPPIARLLCASLERPEADVAMQAVRPWASLRSLLGAALRPSDIVRNISQLDRDETIFTLARIACDLANADGGVLGAEARAWTHDLLCQRTDSPNELEAAVARAAGDLKDGTPIAHAHVVFTLQVLAAVFGTPGAMAPRDGYLAFLMLALNDHIPEWAGPPTTPLTSTEVVLSPLVLSSVFNRSDDVLRFVLRIVDIMGQRPAEAIIPAASWEVIQQEAFGTTFTDYAERFLLPLVFLSRRWGFKDVPILWVKQWEHTFGADVHLFERWFRDATLSIDEAASAYRERLLPSGLLGLPTLFFRKPFVAFGDKLVGLSPWHVKDYATLGTWGKLNEAAKKVLNTTSNQSFSSAFGYFFESWAGSTAREANGSPGSETLILPSAPGAADEIEDLVYLDGDFIALISVKASLVPQASLKTTDQLDAPILWLRRFFFEQPTEAHAKRHRGGAMFLLDRKIQRLREGAYESQGLKRDAVVLPCVLCFDNVGESGGLYKWVGEECRRLGIVSARRGVRPVTIITPEDFEGLMALKSRGRGVCELLRERTEPRARWGPLDFFLHAKVEDSTELRLPSMRARFEVIVERTLARMREAKFGA